MDRIIPGISNPPPCPKGLLRPIHLAHELRENMRAAAFNASRAYRDADGDLPEPLEKVHAALYNGPGIADEMQLRVSQVDFTGLGDDRPTVIEAWYFHCTICGLTLPAQRTQ